MSEPINLTDRVNALSAEAKERLRKLIGPMTQDEHVYSLFKIIDELREIAVTNLKK